MNIKDRIEDIALYIIGIIYVSGILITAGNTMKSL